ncbi:low affinity sulfate transporter 3-like protein [Tanacetum coccineum]
MANTQRYYPSNIIINTTIIVLAKGLDVGSIRHIQGIGYGVLEFLGARIRRIFLDGYGVLVFRIIIFKISSFKLQNARLLLIFTKYSTLFDVITNPDDQLVRVQQLQLQLQAIQSENELLKSKVVNSTTIQTLQVQVTEPKIENEGLKLSVEELMKARELVQVTLRQRDEMVSAHCMSDIDYAGILLALEETNKKLLSGGIKLAIASPWQVIHKLKVAKLVYKVGRDCIFVTVNEAIDSFVGPKFNGPANY